MTLPQPGQWVRVRHACPDVTHDEPVEVLRVVRQVSSAGLHYGDHRIETRRCDGIPMNLYSREDSWEVVT
jgi:hypothetical protein